MSPGAIAALDRGASDVLGRSLTDHERDQMSKYLETLRKWQETHRLVGSTEPEWLVRNVVIDSLCFLTQLPPDVRAVADVGSGAGVPGVPIAIVRPDLHVTLIEARRRRVSFLSTVIRLLGLPNVETLDSRVELLAQSHAARFDAAVMRCAAAPEGLVPLVRPLVKSGGRIVASAAPTSLITDGSALVAVPGPWGQERVFRLYVV